MFRKNLLSGGSALLLTAWVLAGPAAAGTVNLTTRVTAEENYNSNVFSRNSDVKSDWVTQLRPELSVAKEGARGFARVDLRFPAFFYKEYSELNALNRFATYEASYGLTRRLQAFSSGRYRFYESTDQVTEAGADGQDTVLSGGRVDLTRTGFDGGLRWAFTPTLFSTLSYQHSSADYDQGDLRATRYSDTTTNTGIFSLRNQYSSFDSLGLTASYSSTDFQNELSPDTSSDTSSVTAQWVRVWSPRWSSSMSLGVRRVKSDFTSATVEPIVPGTLGDTQVNDTSFSGTGTITLTRMGRRSRLDFVASQLTRPSSGFGTDLDVKSIGGTLRYRLTQRMTVEGSATWSRQKSVGDTVVYSLPITFGSNVFACTGGSVLVRVNGRILCGRISDAGVDTRLFAAALRANWRVSKRFSTFLRYSYRDQVSEGDLFASDFNRHIFSFGVTYNYEADVY